MSMCLKLWPASACGWHGTCAPIANTSEYVCVCESGWSYSKEFDYFSESATTNLCGYNLQRVRLLYTVCSIFSGMGLVLQLVIIRRLKQLKRLLASILSLLFPFSASLFRLQQENTALFGKNLLLMFLIAHGNAFVIIAIAQFLLRYVLYMSKSNPWMSQKMRNRIEHFGKWQQYVMVGDVAVHQLFWIAYFVDHPTAVVLLRICLACMLLRVFYIIYFSQMLLGQYIKDLETVKALGNLALKSSSGTGDARKIVSELVTKHIPLARIFRRTSFLFGFIGLFYFGMPLFLDYAINSIWTYFVPISYILWTVVVLNAIYAAVMRKINAQKLKQNMKGRSSSDGATTSRSHKVMSDKTGNPKYQGFKIETEIQPSALGVSTTVVFEIKGRKNEPQSVSPYSRLSQSSENSEDSYV